MEYSKEEYKKFLQEDPLARIFMGLLGLTPEDVLKEAEEKSRTEKVEKPKETVTNYNEDDETEKKIKSFFDKMVKDGKATATIENGHPHYSIKMENDYKEPEAPETLVEENSRSFSMNKEELQEFVKDYTRLENTFHKLEHAYGIDLNANADSIYTQYNAIVWNLIEKIFGTDNRDDIADYCFGDSNFDTVDDLYEELV